MVFSTKKDFIVKRPLTDKLLINSWKYRDGFENSVKTTSEIGFKYVNIGTWFDNADNGKGLPIFDNEINKISQAIDLCEKYNLKPLINFNGQLGWGFDLSTQSSWSPAQFAAIKYNLNNIFKTFANRGIIWASWNEPNIQYWANDPEGNDYVKTSSWINMEKWIIETTKSYDKNALNIVSGLAGLPSSRQKIYDQEKSMGLFKDADGILTHLYVSIADNKNQDPECLIDMAKIPQTNLPRVSNEFGFPYQQDASNDWQGSVSKERACNLLIREILIQDYLGYAVIGIFCDIDPFYGILNDDGTKPNFLGVRIKDFINKLDGYTFSEKIEVTTHSDFYDDLYVFIYSKDGQPNKLVYWTPNRIGRHEINIYGAKLELNFTESPQIITPDFTPIQKDYFPDIHEDTSLGTKVI